MEKMSQIRNIVIPGDMRDVLCSEKINKRLFIKSLIPCDIR